MPNQPKPDSHSTLGGIFGGHEKKGPDPEISALRHEMNSISRRTRELEERSQNMRKRIQMTDQNLMNQNKRFAQDIKVVTSELNELKHIMNDLDNKMLLLIKELRMCARKEDLNVLEKYINIWEPINFMTRREAEKIIAETVEDYVDKIIKQKMAKHIEDRKV